MGELRRKAAKGVLWSTINNFSVQGLQFILGLILARLLTPEDYGLLGMLAIFFAVSVSFVQSGFPMALIQKKDRDEKDFSTVFYFTLTAALFFYFILFLAAPLIAEFYGNILLIKLTRVLGLDIVIYSFLAVHEAKLSINIDIKTQTKASLSSIIISGAVGIYLAYSGFGVWSLVIQRIIRSVINVVILWYSVKWLPSAGFHLDRLRKLFSFGSKLLVSGLLDTIYNNVYTIIIGKVFSAKELGYYTRANQFSLFIPQNINGILKRVTFPLLVSVQDDDIKLKSVYKKMIKLSALVVFPFSMGLAALAEPLIRIILTEKWIGTVWMLQLLTFSAMLYPIHSMNLTILNVKGRSDLFLKLELVKKVIITIALLVTVPIGIEAMVLGMIITSIIAVFINTYYSRQFIDYSFRQQIGDLLSILILSFGMGFSVYYSTHFLNSDFFKLLLGTIEGVIIYVGIAWVFNIGEIRELPSFVKQFLK